MDNLPDREESIRKRLAHAQQPTAQEIGMTFAAITYASDIAFLLAQNAALRDQLARVTEALYDEVRHPINAKGSAWTDEEIRYYLSAKWGLTIPPEVEAARLARVGLTWAELAARTPTPGAAGEVG